jgi:hypothetical protein
MTHCHEYKARVAPHGFPLACIHLADAQQPKVYRIGFISVASSADMASRVDAFKQGLRELGYVEGQNMTIEYRWAEGKDERLAGPRGRTAPPPGWQ